MMFEDLKRVYESFEAYRHDIPFTPVIAAITLESWGELKSSLLEDEVTSKSYQTLKEEI